MGNTRIYVVTHKDVFIPKIDNYQIIFVGNNDMKFGNVIYDNVGDNIANKNSSFCELTAHYWIWKNQSQNIDYIGLCHYRRFFSTKKFSNNLKNILSYDKANKILNKYDIILPERFVFNKSVYQYYFEDGAGYEKDLQIIRQILVEYYPDFVQSFDSHMKRNSGSYCNMFITNKMLFNDYSEWLFDVLFKAEKLIVTSDYSASQKRVFGYLSELLINVWVLNKKLKVKYLPMLETEKNNYFCYKIKRYLRNFIYKSKYKIKNSINVKKY